MHDDLCEMRLDIPLTVGTDAQGFERAWRQTLAAQKLTGLDSQAVRAVAARFRLCAADLDAARTSAWGLFLAARLAALPGTPSVVADPAAPAPDWRGVKIWLSYHPAEFAALLQKTKRRPNPFSRRGRRP